MALRHRRDIDKPGLVNTSDIRLPILGQNDKPVAGGGDLVELGGPLVLGELDVVFFDPNFLGGTAPVRLRVVVVVTKPLLALRVELLAVIGRDHIESVLVKALLNEV